MVSGLLLPCSGAPVLQCSPIPVLTGGVEIRQQVVDSWSQERSGCREDHWEVKSALRSHLGGVRSERRFEAGMRSRDIFGRLRLRLRLRRSISAPAPAPAPSKTVRRLRLRLREKCTGSGDSGSGSGSDDQVLI